MNERLTIAIANGDTTFRLGSKAIPLTTLKDWMVVKGFVQQDTQELDAWAKLVVSHSLGEISAHDLDELKTFQPSKDGTKAMTTAAADTKLPSTKEVFSNVRVKHASESYSRTKSVACHVKSGKPVQWMGRDVETPSQLDIAKLGAFLKWRASRDRLDISLTDHDRQLVDEMINKDAWCGEIGGRHFAELTDNSKVKALLSDSGTGGQQLNPVWFDEAVVTYPLLKGELFPYIDLVDMPRSNTAQAAGLNNVSVTWGTAEGTALTMIDATGLVQNLNANVNNVMAAIEIGRDLLADTPINLGQVAGNLIGEAMAASLDYVIVNGDGSTQPQGLANASGLTALSTVNGPTGPYTCGDIESLLLGGIAKQYRTPQYRIAFISNDTTYRRVRAIPQGEAMATRLFGMNHGSYEVLDTPWRINNSIADGTAYCAALARYRMYRRQGQETRFTDQGQTLTLKNTVLLTVRSRYAGRFTGGAAAAYFTNGALADNG